MDNKTQNDKVRALVEDAKKEVRAELISKFTAYLITGLLGIGALVPDVSPL